MLDESFPKAINSSAILKQITHLQDSSFVVEACANPFQMHFQVFFGYKPFKDIFNKISFTN
jgi:hypothetical protein